MGCAYGKIIFLSSLSIILITLVLTNGVLVPLPFAAVSGLSSQAFWTLGPSMPTPRSEIGVASLGDKIYVIGGQDLNKQGKKTDIVEVYDLKSKNWSTTAPLPEPLDHFGVASNDGKIYVVGGYANDISNKLLIYDPHVGKWMEGKPMPTARTALTANFIDGKLYAVGGVDSFHNVVTTNGVYDPKSDTWTEKAPMPTARHHLTSSVVDGKLYAIGGRLLGDGIPRPVNEALSNFNDNEMYDPFTNMWTKLDPMPTKRSGLASASIGNDIYVFGGQSVNGTFRNNEKYNTKTDTWSTEIPMPTSRLGLKAEAFNNSAYVIGGKLSLKSYVGGEVEIFHVPKY
jgi:N-acetylneuraminic acid mutarotase